MGAYNSEKYIRDSVDSILNQSYSDFEFIIVNDGSTDATVDILRDYEKAESRIRVINNEENIGLTSSLNKAIKMAQGKYIARMDADDICHPLRLEKQFEYLQKRPEVIVLGTSAFNIDEEGDIINERLVPHTHGGIKKAIKLVNPLIHSSVMFRKEKIEQLGNYNEQFPIVQDYELWFRVLANDYQMANLTEKLIYYRVNDAYYQRKSLKYRITDFKIRWQGYRLIGLPFFKRYGLIIPIILGLLPSSLMRRLYSFLKKYDPRNSS